MNYQAKHSTVDRRSAPRRRPTDKDPGEQSFRNMLLLLLFPLFFIYLETVTHISLGFEYSGSYFVYSMLFAISAGLMCALLGSVLDKKINHWIVLGLMTLFSVYYGFQLVYYKFFKEFCSVRTADAAGGNFIQFFGNTVKMIWQAKWSLIILLLPVIAYAIFGKKAIKPVAMNWGFRAAALLLSLVFFFGGTLFVNLHNDLQGDKYFYNEGFMMSDAGARFGVLTAGRLDFKYAIFGDPEEDIPDPSGNETTVDWGNLFGTTASDDPTQTPGTGPSSPDTQSNPGTGTGTDVPTTPVDTAPETEPPKPLDTSPNVLDIDFDALIAKTSNNTLKNVHSYFSTREPTAKNEYTGIFKDKNLIWITVESWAPAAINEKLTPWLYKMKTEGFVFDNYYCSNWGGSTATGEYANITGNFFGSADCLKLSAKCYEPFTAGNMFKAAGYKTYAFHNWTYSYYGRDQSHPNFGYNYYGTQYVSSGAYPGIKGWDVKFTRAWPLSDQELGANTRSFIPSDGSKFHIYYMTVSGHAYQTWDSSMSRKHKAEVLSLGLTNPAGKPYTADYALSFIAAQYEVELMVKELCEELEAKGILEDTVFVLSPDHYPYQISEDETKNMAALSEMYNLPADGIYLNYELYKAPLIIWSASMKEPVKVPKVCSAIDILPTVLNLFGMKYDSRLIMGRDILSDSEGFVILNMSNAGGTASSLNWLTDYGFYNATKKTFTPAPGVTVDVNALKNAGYFTHYSSLVSTMYTYSKYILNNNYYKTVFPNGLN